MSLNIRAKVASSIVAVLFSLLMGPPLDAAIVSYKFTGEILAVNDPNNYFSGTIVSYDPFSGSFLYDTDAIDEDEHPQRGHYTYDSPPTGINVRINGLDFYTNPSGGDIYIEVWNDYVAQYLQDYIQMHDQNAIFPIPESFDRRSLVIAFDDPSHTALDSTDLPHSLDYASWDSVSLTIQGIVWTDPSKNFLIYGTIKTLKSMQPTVSPEDHDFAIVDTSCTSVQQFTVLNEGEDNFEISSLNVTGTNSSEFFIQNDNCSGITLEPSDTCTFDLAFQPGSLGSKEAMLEIAFTDPDIYPLEVPLSGLVTEICECDLNQDNSCDGLDWLLFYPDWGRSDCEGSPDPCECDLNQDGSCNGLDWLLFYPNWGRTDCPVCP